VTRLYVDDRGITVLYLTAVRLLPSRKRQDRTHLATHSTRTFATEDDDDDDDEDNVVEKNEVINNKRPYTQGAVVTVVITQQRTKSFGREEVYLHQYSTFAPDCEWLASRPGSLYPPPPRGEGRVPLLSIDCGAAELERRFRGKSSTMSDIEPRFLGHPARHYIDYGIPAHNNPGGSSRKG
jgi:hypothetical protein